MLGFKCMPRAVLALTLDPGEPVSAELDREKMTQVLLNLLRNAIEAASPVTRASRRRAPRPARA